MPTNHPRDCAPFTAFDPQAGTVIREPPGDGVGYWAGAPGVMFDGQSGAFFLVYRLRRPRGVEPDRGAEVRIARSEDGIRFEDVWAGLKTTLGTTSIERCALARLPGGGWGLYVSYVDPADGRWRIDLAEADRPEAFDLADCRPMLTAADVGTEGVKDPFIFRVAGLYHMLVSFATAVEPDSQTVDPDPQTVEPDSVSPVQSSESPAPSTDLLHKTHDAYNTGLVRSRTGLAVSDDGMRWQWEGEVFGPSENGWDRYCARIGTVWRSEGIWLALYDGSADVAENYEERCGLAWSFDLRTFHRVTRTGPLFVQPNASGAVRYFDVIDRPEWALFYYETARPDGSHDLRVFRRAK